MTFEKQDPRPTVSFRESEEIVARLDDLEMSKSEFIRSAVREKLDRTPDGSEMHPPVEADLARAYSVLCDMANGDGIVRLHAALSRLAQEFGLPRDSIKHTYLRKLSERGYLKRRSNIYGHEAMKIRR